jgi:hypothetical protein
MALNNETPKRFAQKKKKKKKGEINLQTVYYKYQMPTDRVWNIHGIHVFTFNQ